MIRNEKLHNIMYQCHLCVMCPNNPFHCSSEETCNANKSWKLLTEEIRSLETELLAQTKARETAQGAIKQLLDENKKLEKALDKAIESREFVDDCPPKHDGCQFDEKEYGNCDKCWKEWCMREDKDQ